MLLRYSKSILLFLFVSSILSAFKYALDRTNRNVIRSIMFTMYYLSIKANLFGLALIDNDKLFDKSQLNQQHVVKTRVVIGYTCSDDFYARSPRVYMGENKVRTITTSQYPGSNSVVIELRAGADYDDLK